ncbi:tenascin-N-like [Lineus longissimus]|uniref:tenascin-N-like n=1 Tax=Lineus longissimus TaxID=88925 RepID=UPI00315CBD8D
MTRPNSIGIAAAVFLLTADYVNLVTSAVCTDDCTPFTPGAVAYWPFNAETKGADLSGNGNHVTLVGLTYTEGPSGVARGAVHFEGNNSSYAWVSMSPSLEVGKHSGFSVCGFVRFRTDMPLSPLIDSRNVIDKGWGVYAFPKQSLFLGLDLNNRSLRAPFTNMTFPTGSWRFFGLSYDKATGRVIGFMDGKQEEIYIVKNVAAETTKTKKVAFGRSFLPNRDFYNGDLSCMMLFEVALKADDFERIWKFCSTMNSTQIQIPNIAMTDITPTSARASWTKSPGTFARYHVTIERKQSESGRESAYPNFLWSSVAFPKVYLANLVPGDTYRVRVWHMQGSVIGRARSSQWFETMLLPVVEPESIIFSVITSTTAIVNWKEVSGNIDGYIVYLSPTAGGSKADPSTVPRGTVATSLMNLTPGSYYTITIRTKISESLSSPSTTTFQTKELTRVEKDSITFSTITTTSAKVTWKEVNGDIDGYVVDLSPTAGGAKAVPSTVPTGTVTTFLMNLTPGSYYTITIRTKIGTSLSSPSTTTFSTEDLPKMESPIAVAGLAVAVIGLFLIVVFISVICILIRKIGSSSTSNGDERQIPMSNIGFKPDESSQSNTRNNDENENPYEIPDRLNTEENIPGPLYENVTVKEESNYAQLNVACT